MPLIPQPLAITAGASAKFTNPMQPGCQYIFSCEVDCWIAVGATGGAAQADTAGNVFVKAGQEIPLANLEDSGTTNSFVHVISQAADGDASLTQYRSRLA
jgi:hypothetical protein